MIDNQEVTRMKQKEKKKKKKYSCLKYLIIGNYISIIVRIQNKHLILFP